MSESSGPTDSREPGRKPFLQAILVVFTGTLVVQAVGFLRQLVIASAFGVDRAMDLYVLVFTVAAVVGFGLGAVIDSAALPLLVQRLERGDREGFRQIGTRIIAIGLALGAAATLLFLATVPLVARLVTTGLAPADKAAMSGLALWFTPWVAIAAPYYAVGALVKAESRFRRFMAAELVVTIVSLAVLFVWRPGVFAIPLAYAAGYAVALATMLPGLPVATKLTRHAYGRSGQVMRQIWRFAVVAQAGTAGALADRFLASHLPAGAIAAGSYAGLVTGQTAALLGFRDAYMVPLSETDRRAEKLERMLAGLLMLSIPCAFFLSAYAEAVIGVLLERGRFDAAAVALASQMLTVQAAAIPASVLVMPLYRMLQIMDRMRFAGYLLLASAAANLVLGSILMFGLGQGLKGYLIASLVGAHLTFAFACVLLRIAGLRFGLAQPAMFAVYAAAASAMGLWAAGAVDIGGPRWLALLKDAILFAGVYLLACLAILRPLQRLAGPFRAAAPPGGGDGG